MKNKIFFLHFLYKQVYLVDYFYKYWYNTNTDNKKNPKGIKSMKNKGLTEKNKKKRSRISHKILTVFFICILFICLPVGIYANNSFRVENCNKCEEYSQKLGKEINDFIALDEEPTKAVSTQVTSAVNEYRKYIIDLQSHPDVEKRSLENEIILYYTKGNAAGRLAWVYYYNIYTFEIGVSSDKINAKYTSCKSAIENATQHTVLSAECEVMLDELNRLIYTERAKNLALANDSLTASSLISGTVESFKSITSPDLFGEKYMAEYKILTEKLGLQRVRDTLRSEAESTFKLICPNESFSSSHSASLLIYELENAQSVKAMNNATVDFIETLVSIDEKKPYSSVAKKEYLSLTKDAASRATEAMIAAKITSIFESYGLSIKKAEIKDSVYALFLGSGNTADEELVKLEQDFNRDGGIIDSCKTDSEVENELTNAKAELFVHKHKEILARPLDDLTTADEPLAKNALIEYSTLEEKVKQKLITQINSIAEKYNSTLILKIRSYLPDDALYLDFCEIIAKEIKSVSRKNIDDFYNIVTRIPQKAEALSKAVYEYRALLGAENYSGYEQSEKDSLLSALNEMSNALSKITPADVAIYYDEILDAQTSAIRKLNIIDQSVRVRIATRSSKNDEILNELNTAYEKISLCSEKSEMILQANRAIYKIQRLLTNDAIIDSCSEAKSAISAMDFLERSEKEAFISAISAIEVKAKEAKEAENISALENIWKDFSDSLHKITEEAEAIDLSRAISAYTEKINETVKIKLDVLKALKYISKEKYDEIYNDIQSLQSNSKQAIPLCNNTAEVISEYADFLKKLDKLLSLADTEDLEGYKIYILSAFDKYEKIKANYSVENYNKILNIKATAKEKLSSATSKNECDTILSNAQNEILLINDLLDDEKNNALNSLLELLNILKKDSPLYSAASFAKIEGLYEESKIEIGKIEGIENISLVKQTLSKYISLIRDVRKDSLYTSDAAHKISIPSLQYPEDYDLSEGLHGSIHLAGGLVSDADFSIDLLEQKRNKEIEELIRKSAKQGNILSTQELSEQTLKLLRSSSVAATIDISLSRISDGASGYTVKMLIPNDLASENILGLAFVDGEEVEFYPIDRADSLISVKLDHFSKYYIVVESTLNVQPLLIALVILLALEFLVLLGIIYLRYKRKNSGGKQEKSDLPELPISAMIPFAPILTKVYPENGLTLAILLSIAAIALGMTIALLIRADAKKVREQKEPQKQLKGKKEPMLLNEGKQINTEESIFFADRDNDEFCMVGSAINHRTNRAEIDLDVITKNFKSGETVDITTLKQKGLIDENVEYIKILTNGSLTKPFKIEANEFSNAAREVIELSGGEIKDVENK